jgi:hypothetical protein
MGIKTSRQLVLQEKIANMENFAERKLSGEFARCHQMIGDL